MKEEIKRLIRLILFGKLTPSQVAQTYGDLLDLIDALPDK